MEYFFIVVFLILILFNVPIAASMGLASVVGLLMNGFHLDTVASILYASVAKSSYLAIPFFIITGVIMDYAGISQRLIHLASTCVGHKKGGLVIVVVVAACFFAAISGSGPATVAALGGVLIPGMEKAGYNKARSAALLAAAGGIGPVIPPSIAFVIFAMLAEVSVGTLFLCGIIPGILMGIVYGVAGIIAADKDGGVIKQEKASAQERMNALKDAMWGIITPVVILGGIYGGIFTPTEAAGIAAVYALFVGVVIYKEINFKAFCRAMLDSAKSTAVVMYIMACAGLFTWLLTTTGIAAQMSQVFMSISNNKYVLLLLMNILFLIMGCFIDTNSAMYIMLPILLPVINAMEYSVYAFGVFFVVNFAVGMITPPVGGNLYVACNIANLSMKEICAKILPFIIAGIVVVLLLTYIPQLSLFIPGLFGML